VAAALVLAASVSAADADQVARLIAQLGSDSFARREAA
jgi:hypothetical protein